MTHPFNADTKELERAWKEGRQPASANMLEVTTLEKCRNQAMDNMSIINDIGSRVTGLLTRLRGLEPRTGIGSDGDTEPRGMLVVHHEQLEYEARRLGEIQADLAELERLL